MKNIINTRLKLFLILLIAMTSTLFVLNAEDKAEGKKEEKVKERDLKDRVWMEGKIVAIDAWLKEKHGAKSEATLYSKGRMGFVKKSDGTLHTFIDNTRGHNFLGRKKLKGQEIKVQGWAFKNTNYVEIWRYQLKKDGKWIDYDFCKDCGGFEKGYHKDKDLCPNCLEE